jgi:hypothetical protein
MAGMMKKPLGTIKPKATPTAKPKVTPKPKATPTPKFTPPTLAQYKQSAAYRAGDWTYKQYVDEFKMQYDSKYRRK